MPKVENRPSFLPDDDSSGPLFDPNDESAPAAPPLGETKSDDDFEIK